MRARIEDLENLVLAYVAARLRGKKHLGAHDWFKGIGAERTYENGWTVRCVWRPTLARVLASLDCFDARRSGRFLKAQARRVIGSSIWSRMTKRSSFAT